MTKTQRINPDALPDEPLDTPSPDMPGQKVRPTTEREGSDDKIAEKTLQEIADSHEVSVHFIEDILASQLGPQKISHEDLEVEEFAFETKHLNREVADKIPDHLSHPETTSQQTVNTAFDQGETERKKLTAEDIISFARVVGIAALVLLLTGLWGVYAGVLNLLVGGIGTIVLLLVTVFSYYIQHFVSADE